MKKQSMKDKMHESKGMMAAMKPLPKKAKKAIKAKKKMMKKGCM